MQDSVHGSFATEAAGRSGKEVSGEAFPVAFMVIDEEDHGVVVTGFKIDTPDLIDGLYDSFGEEKSHYKNFIVARGAHEDGERPAIYNDLERLLNG